MILLTTRSSEKVKRVGEMMKWSCSGSVWLLLLLLTIPRHADASPPRHTLADWFDPRTSPFIPLPEVATDPNGGTTVGLLPVFLFTDARQHIRQILAPDITHNPNL